MLRGAAQLSPVHFLVVYSAVRVLSIDVRDYVLTQITLAGSSTGLSWRWACESNQRISVRELIETIVYLNLPVCLVAFIVLFFSLRTVQLQQSANISWRVFIQRFDFLGL